MMQNAHLRSIIEETEARNMAKKKKGNTEDFANAIEQSDAITTLTFHQTPLATLLADLGTSESAGLTDAKAKENLKIYGLNKLKEKHTNPWYVKLLLEMVGLYCLILWAGSILSFIGYGLTPSDPSNVNLLLQTKHSYTWE